MRQTPVRCGLSSHVGATEPRGAVDDDDDGRRDHGARHAELLAACDVLLPVQRAAAKREHADKRSPHGCPSVGDVLLPGGVPRCSHLNALQLLARARERAAVRGGVAGRGAGAQLRVEHGAGQGALVRRSVRGAARG